MACTPAARPDPVEVEPKPQILDVAGATVVDPPLAPMPPDAVIELTRTRCYGGCPAYEVSMDADGHVSWEGTAHVTRKGAASWSVSAKAVEGLWQELDGLPWDRLPPSTGEAECPELFSDHPSFTLVVRAGGVSRGITHYTGCKGHPDYDALGPVSHQVDFVADTEAAIGSRE